MPGLKLYTSNRLESLLDALASVVQDPLASPFESEVIVVQSKGMERWLSMELAKKFGVWMNSRFPFPNKFIWEIFGSVLHDIPDASQLGPQVTTWSIMRLLPQCLGAPGFGVIDNYLHGERTHLKRLQLAERIADVFDAYGIYRPEMVLAWDEGKEGGNTSERWQAELWRALFKNGKEIHRARIMREFLRQLATGKTGPEKLPERISIFGIPALPRYHLEVVNALASLVDVHFFLLSPTREYWGDIVPEERTGADRAGLLHLEVGNQLLASMGKLGRDFFSLLVNKDYEEISSYREPGGESLLACLQSDILNLITRGKDQKLTIGPQDRSVQIHSCHSPMREAEVLYDNLLDLFQRRPDLTPKDIIVMTPDIESYAPYITAIFGAGQTERTRIPFSIADRRALSESHVADIFFKILNLKGGRLTAPEVIDLIDNPSIQERFGFGVKDMELIMRWVEETHVSWGKDRIHREQMGLPAFDEGSWKSGVDRLLLGYALRGNEESLFHDILPYDDIEGSETETLGRFLEFLSLLFASVNELEGERTLAEWAELLESIFSRFLAENQENQREIQLLRSGIRDLSSRQTLSGFMEPVEFEVIRYYLSKRLRDDELSVGFMTGAVTFCEMLPMRSIPFQVVALIGMNSDAYPREYRPVGFDLIAHDPRAGDRSLRDEDRYLFLEAILSSRECLYISYVGQSIRDNSEIPPSVLVSELVDHIGQGFHAAGGEDLRGHIVQQHRLQPFSPAYFSGEGRLFSYSEEDCETARMTGEDTPGAVPFISKPIASLTVQNRDISIQDLKRFFRNPARYFLNRSLGIYLDERVEVPQDQEPLYELNALEEFKIKDWLTSRKMAGHDLGDYYSLVKGKGILPPATPGKAAYREISRVVDLFAEELRYHTGRERLPPLDVDMRVDDVRITGRLENIWKSNLVAYQCVDKDRARHHLDTWIDHVILNCTRKPKYPRGSIYVRMGGAWFFNPLEDARTELKKLLACYLTGITEPLRFFPQTSMKYAERFLRRGHDDALKAARADWEGSDFGRSEKDDPYVKLCFSRVDALDERFASVAVNIIGPLIQNRDKLKR